MYAKALAPAAAGSRPSGGGGGRGGGPAAPAAGATTPAAGTPTDGVAAAELAAALANVLKNHKTLSDSFRGQLDGLASSWGSTNNKY